MKLTETILKRVKNPKKITKEGDFQFNAFSFLILALFTALGIALQLSFSDAVESMIVIAIGFGAFVFAGVFVFFPLWSNLVKMLVLIWFGGLAFYQTDILLLQSAITLGFLFGTSIHIVSEWDKAVILRFGRFKKVHGPGLFVIFPLVDRITAFVDTRIRAVDFSAEKTITKDTVPVHVDALAFWMIWDAKKAILEVENFIEAVTLSAQTALRDSIGKHSLAELLSHREILAEEIKNILEAKTNDWGITILSIEFTDIIIPQSLEDSMSKQAQAERERQSRVILSEAEVEVAKKFKQAAEDYRDNPNAMHLRAMNMIYEGIRNKASMMILPSSALDSMNLGNTLGTLAFQKQEQQLGIHNDGETKEADNKDKDTKGGTK